MLPRADVYYADNNGMEFRTSELVSIADILPGPHQSGPFLVSSVQIDDPERWHKAWTLLVYALSNPRSGCGIYC